MATKRKILSYGFIWLVFISWIIPFYINVYFLRHAIPVADALAPYLLGHGLALLVALVSILWIVIDLRKKKPFNKLVHIVSLILAGAILLMMSLWMILVLFRV